MRSHSVRTAPAAARDPGARPDLTPLHPVPYESDGWVTVALPYPPSANRYWRHWRGRVVISSVAREYRREVQLLARAAGMRPVSDSVEIRLWLRPVQPADWARRVARDPIGATVRCLDLDNARKIAYDALQGVAFWDDSQVWADAGWRITPEPRGALYVAVRPYSV